MTLDKGLDWDSLLPKNTPSTSIQIEPVTAVIRGPIVPSPKESHKVEHDHTSQLKEPSVRKSTTSKYELPKDLELDLNLAMVPSDNPVSDIEINLLYSQGTQKEENKSSDMKQMMREKGFDIESLLAAENPSQPQQDPEEVDYQKALTQVEKHHWEVNVQVLVEKALYYQKLFFIIFFLFIAFFATDQIHGILLHLILELIFIKISVLFDIFC